MTQRPGAKAVCVMVWSRGAGTRRHSGLCPVRWLSGPSTRPFGLFVYTPGQLTGVTRTSDFISPSLRGVGARRCVSALPPATPAAGAARRAGSMVGWPRCTAGLEPGRCAPGRTDAELHDARKQVERLPDGAKAAAGPPGRCEGCSWAAAARAGPAPSQRPAVGPARPPADAQWRLAVTTHRLPSILGTLSQPQRPGQK